MDMEDANAIAGTAQGDLADVVARAGAMAAAVLPSTSRHHRPPPPSLAADQPAMAAAGQIMIPAAYDEEPRPSSMAAMFHAPSTTVDPYGLSPATTTMAPRGGGGYWLPPPQLMAVQIPQSACCGREMGGAAAGEVDGDDPMRISPPTPAAHQMMKRKNEVKKVVCIPAPPAMSGRPGGGEVIPSDLWAWRKYGQKPIKGSPYPRGYYRCSSSKGCMARKQVERSRSDPNMLVITYTAEHNHPWPMQRNILAGYSRPHMHMSTNCKKKSNYRIDTSSSSSSSKNNFNYYSEQNAVIDSNFNCQHPMRMMEDNAINTIGALGGVTHAPVASCNDLQPSEEVFAELEELEPSDNNPTNANIYTMGVSYEWHKF
ncbi:hypothetical protein ACP4OV_001867 [Aristida adscensionis]